MKSSEIREAFLKYFQSKDHTLVTSSSLLPANDPTLLFTNAGMNQFKDCFLGSETRSYKRAVTCQKVMRISGKHNDLENVGVTPRHHTFFEMLGNFSFGDYFKAEAIQFAWDFVTKILELPESRLWVTIFEKDDEAAKLWTSLTPIKAERVVRLGEKDNFWAMGETGPCGPCSEIHYYQDKEESKQSAERLRRDDGSFLEIWNLVFMQYNREPGGTLNPLPKPSVDTGMGLERITAIIQGKNSNYDNDLLRGIISLCEQLSGYKYDGSSYEYRDTRSDSQYERDIAMRVIADHSRAIAFLIADGVLPGSEGRGYVLRRLIRRAVRHGRALHFKEIFLPNTTLEVVRGMGAIYPELQHGKETINKIVEAEEKKFHETLDSGLQILEKEVTKLKKGSLFPGKTAFLLHDTYGFPLDLTEDALKPFNCQVDRNEFDREMAVQKERSREDRRTQNITFTGFSIKGEKTKFLGYAETEAEATLLQVFDNPDSDDGTEKYINLLFNATPFYAESGGQVGDTGDIIIQDLTLEVLDTQKVQEGYYLHACKILEGAYSPKLINQKAILKVNKQRRSKIRVHHSATHLVHSALRNILGIHVKQAGSRVDEYSFRFDYSHFNPVSPNQLQEIQSFVNSYIRDNLEVITQELSLEEAKKTGAIALFGEKYGDKVRVVEIGPKSKEFCGGTHITRSGDIGFIIVTQETGVAAGVRRIECVAGDLAHETLLKVQSERQHMVELLKGDSGQLSQRVEKLVSQCRSLERELETARGKLALAESEDLLQNVKLSPNGIKIIAQQVDVLDIDTLKTMVDRTRQRLGSGVVALGCVQGSGAVIIAGVTSDLTSKIHAGELVKKAVQSSGGKGGGRADFAQAGGLGPDSLGPTLEKLVNLVV